MKKDILEVIKEGEQLFEVRGRTSHIENFEEKLAGLAALITNKKGFSTRKRAAMLEEAATTSEFPLLFGTILDRQLLAKYQIYGPDWAAYVKRGTQMDFRKQALHGVFGLQGGLAEVKPQTEYKQDASMGEGKVEVSLTKFGRRWGMGWEIIINDDLGAFNDTAERLANAARRTEWREVTKLIAAAGGGGHASLYGAPIVHPVDGKNVTNKFSGAGTALSVTSLSDAVTKFKQQVDADGEPILVDGFELVVPPALEITALQVLQSQLLLAAGGDGQAGAKLQIQPNKNVLSAMSITLHVNPYLPIVDQSANKDKTWYLFAKLSSGAAVQMNFLRGHETPEVVMKNPNKLALSGGVTNPLEGDFETDSMEWRVRHILGGTQVDPRMTIVMVGA